MRIFLSWSGSVSKQVASTLRDWLPKVIQAIDPWMSAEDIDKGSRWSSEVEEQLRTIKAGIICVTVENQAAPWLNFEAGALSKTVEKEMVCPFLFGLRPSDLTGPLSQFQMTEAIREDVKRLLNTLNKGLSPRPLSDEMLADAFETRWQQLEQALKKIEIVAPAPAAHRSVQEMVSELVVQGREQSRWMGALMTSVNELQEAESRRIRFADYGVVDPAWVSPDSLRSGLNNLTLLSQMTKRNSLDTEPATESGGSTLLTSDAPGRLHAARAAKKANSEPRS